MADATLSTTISRRTILAGGGAVLSATAMPSIAAPPDPDAELLRRIAAAARLRADYIAASDHCTRLFAALRRHPDYPAEPYSDAGCWTAEALAQRTGCRAANNEAERLYERHQAAIHAAFAVPARTLAGLHAKLRHGLTAAKDCDAGTMEEGDYRWLDNAMADMDWLAVRVAY